MERTRTNPPKSLPDAINCVCEQYAQVPYSILKNPEISALGKVILTILTSNQGGWHSYLNHLLKCLNEGKYAVHSTIKQLEKQGYIKKCRYRNEKTMFFVGSFIAITTTPFQFNLDGHLEFLKEHNLIIPELMEKGRGSDLLSGRATLGQPGSNYNNIYNYPKFLTQGGRETTHFPTMGKFLQSEEYASMEKCFDESWLEDKKFISSMKDYSESRRKIKVPITDKAMKKIASSFKKSGLSIQQATDCLDLSVLNGWRGVFPESILRKDSSGKISNRYKESGSSITRIDQVIK